MTYNVRGLRAGVAAVERVVRAADPDILLLQETGGRSALRRLARSLGMRFAADPFGFPRRRVKNAVLVRSPWELLGSRLHRFEGSARFYPRGVVIAEVRSGSGTVRLASVHLGLRPAERMRHARALEEPIGTDGPPSIIGGDFNEFPTGRAISSLSSRFADAWTAAARDGRADGEREGATFPATEPVARIDYVFVPEQVEVRSALVPAGPETVAASDHRPLVVELGLANL